MADYAITAVARRVVYTGSAGLGPYSFSFPVLVAGDLAVYFNTTVLTITTDYTVSVGGAGTGTVTIVTGGAVSSTPDADNCRRPRYTAHGRFRDRWRFAGQQLEY